jgi:hypothetical protein
VNYFESRLNLRTTRDVNGARALASDPTGLRRGYGRAALAEGRFLASQLRGGRRRSYTGPARGQQQARPGWRGAPAARRIASGQSVSGGAILPTCDI